MAPWQESVGVAEDHPQRMGVSATVLTTALLIACLQSLVEKVEKSPQEEKPNDNDLEVRLQRIIVHTENKEPKDGSGVWPKSLKTPQVCRRRAQGETLWWSV